MGSSLPFNFSDKDLDYELRLPGYKKIQELLSSNMEIYGGSQKRRHPAKKLTGSFVKITLPAFSAVYYTSQLSHKKGAIGLFSDNPFL